MTVQAASAGSRSFCVIITVFLLALTANTSRAAEMEYTWKVTSPFIGSNRSSQAQAEADLHAYTGGVAPHWYLMTESYIKNQTFSPNQTNYVYEAPPKEIEMGPWHTYSLNSYGGNHIGSSEAEVWEATMDDIEVTYNPSCGSIDIDEGEWEPHNYWVGSSFVTTEEKDVVITFPAFSTCEEIVS
ncbi:MAG TPA: hypothetical protein VGL10_03550, partial [Gammaproteobacteria bacterium]